MGKAALIYRSKSNFRSKIGESKERKMKIGFQILFSGYRHDQKKKLYLFLNAILHISPISLCLKK